MSDAPYTEESDAAVVAGCVDGKDAAWTALLERHGLLVEAVVMRVLDELRSGGLEQAPSCVDSVIAGMRRNHADVLRAWNGGSTLRHYLAVITRQMATSYLQDVTPPVRMQGGLPPAAMFLDDFVADEPAKAISKAVDRMPPQVVATVRLRLRGLDPDAISVTLGMPKKTVLSHLERVASKLGELHGKAPENATSVWRVVLDAATTKERVELSLRTHDDLEFRKLRDDAELAWRATRQRAFMAIVPKGPDSLDEVTLAAFVDGTLRGAERARVEGKLVMSPRSVDTVAALVGDVRVIVPLKDTQSLDRETSLAAACVATGRFRVGESLAEEAISQRGTKADEILRLARLGQTLEGYTRPEVEPSRVVNKKGTVKEDERGFLAAFELLAHDAPSAAAQALDDQQAKTAFGARLRLLAYAAGADLVAALEIANDVAERPRADPGLLLDVQAVLALPAGRSLPREILVERLRDAIADAVRVIID